MEKNLRRLDYAKIIERLVDLARSGPGKELAANLQPRTCAEDVVFAQQETEEGRKVLRVLPAADLYGWHDLRALLHRVEMGDTLSPAALLSVGVTLQACRRIKNTFVKKETDFPILHVLTGRLPLLEKLEREIDRAITPEGEVADHASANLSALRRKIRSCVQLLQKKLEDFLRSSTMRPYLQEPVVTLREDRYVLPVKVENRSQVPGIVHDTSSSGATLFIEPMATVELNNDLRRVKTAEEQEVKRILQQLSLLVADFSLELKECMDVLGRLDFIMAKAELSARMDALTPQLAPGPFLVLKRARHPLLANPVPINIELGDGYNTLLITGPNTGGKTVALKTVGLLVLMHQAGLQVPAGEDSRMGVFDSVYADIGDEQSIEEALSTFSSHLANMVQILLQAGEGSLVLLDEMGGGTDPVEGSALARAILEELGARGVKTIASTHLSELKDFAVNQPRMEIASMVFDSLTFRPTYQLVTGRPGRSYALEMAQRTGLPVELVERAKSFLSAEQLKTAEILDQLEQELEIARREKEQAQIEYAKAASSSAMYEKLLSEIKEKQKDTLARARSEALNLVGEARRETRLLLEELKASLKSARVEERGDTIRKARMALAGIESRLEESALCQAEDTSGQPVEIRPGQEVFLQQYGQNGIVLNVYDDGTVQVQAGIMKLTVPQSALAGVKVKEKKEAGYVSLTGNVEPHEVPLRLDMRGLRAEEALLEMDKYLDDALLAGLSFVYLIHGKGTGALRSAVHRALSERRGIKRYRLGELGEGGGGVTVVELK